MDHEWQPDKQRYLPRTPVSSSPQHPYQQTYRSAARDGAVALESTTTRGIGQNVGPLSFSRGYPTQEYGVQPYERFDPSTVSRAPPTSQNDHQYGLFAYPPMSPPTLTRNGPYFVDHKAVFSSPRFGQEHAQQLALPLANQERSGFGPQIGSESMPHFLPPQAPYSVSATRLAPPWAETLMSRSGSAASFETRHDATTISQQHTRHLRLHGPARPGVNVTGPKEALQKLGRAVGIDGLVVKQQIYGNDRSVLDASLKYHKDKGSWPATEQSSVLVSMNEDELLRFGITADDYNVSQVSSIYPQGEPPYRTRELNPDGLQALLRIIPKYHDNGSPDGPRVWALGIVNKFMDNTYQAKLFRAEKGPSTHELWFVREVIGPHDDFVEVWRPLVAQSSVSIAKERYRRPVLKHPLQYQGSDSGDLDQDGEPGGWSPEPLQKSKPRNLRRYNHRTARWSQYKHLSWEEILDEGKIPIEDFCGEVMLEVAACFSNKEIALRTNVWRPQETSENLVWQVIKRALMDTIGKPGWPRTYKEAYRQFEDIRVRNNVKKKEQAGRKSRIGIAPTRKYLGTGLGRTGSARRIRVRHRSVSDVSSLSAVMDDLPIFIGDDTASQRRPSKVSEMGSSDDETLRSTVRNMRKLRSRKARRTASTAQNPSHLDEDDEERGGVQGIKEEYDDEDGSAYEEDEEEEL